MRKIDWRLSALQVGSMLFAVVLTVILVALYHHLTEDYYIPLAEYLGSIKLVAPPLLVLISSYLLTFLLGEKFSDAPRLAIKYIKDSFLQNTRAMMLFVLGVSLLSVILLYKMSSTAPPHYEVLVARLLGGEQDRQQLILKDISYIAEKNSTFAKQLKLVDDVFYMRSKWNFSDGLVNTTEPRILVRALDSNNVSAWQNHPLRIHALAEAYSMWAQAAMTSSYVAETEDWKELLRKSIELYDQVIHSSSPLATPLMKVSARHNAGNVYLYANDLDNALAYYDMAMKENKNLSTAGNIILIFILQGKYEQAARLGDEYMDWGRSSGKALTEGSSYSGVAGNAAFAHLMLGDYKGGLRLMVEAYDVESDDLNTLNLAVALTLSGRLDSAETLMVRHFKYPVLEVADQASRVTDKYNRCYYLVDAAMNKHSKTSIRAANLYMYLGEARTVAQLEAETSESLETLLAKVEGAVQSDASSCKDFLRVPGFKNLLHGI